MSEDESTRDRFQSDEEEAEDVEAHRKHGGAMHDDGDDEDDVEAHRKHGGA